jgi:hypothetical protein
MNISDEQLRFEQTLRSKSPRQILANVRRLIGRRRIQNWVLAMEVYAVGSTYAHWICSDNGIDPDAYTLAGFDAPSMPKQGVAA